MLGMADHVKAELEVTETKGEFIGYVTETELVFEKPFRPLDFVPLASLAGAWISLLYSLRPSAKDLEKRRSEPSDNMSHPNH